MTPVIYFKGNLNIAFIELHLLKSLNMK